jgi:serine/threonine protein phosphatase PrpC
VVPISNDHKPDVPKERKRIQMAGGVVEPYKDTTGEAIGPVRIWVSNSQPPVPGLAMSRSIGDKMAATIGVIAKPEVTSFYLSENDKFMIIASDGIYEFLSNEHIVNVVSQYWEKGKAEEACDHLVSQAVERWKEEDTVIDDITIVIVFFDA